MMAAKGKKTFAALLGCSLFIHLGLYFWIAGLYRSNADDIIELSIENVTQSEARAIPRPRFRPKLPQMPKNIEHRPTGRPRLPDMIRPVAVEPVDSPVPETLMAKIDVPEMPAVPSLAGAGFSSSLHRGADAGYFGSAQDYLDMVRLKIDSAKKYPRQAKAMRREGRVTVIFQIEPSGKVRDLVIKNSSGNKLLEQAALEAIRKSSPLPQLPRAHFHDNLQVELTIAFELL